MNRIGRQAELMACRHIRYTRLVMQQQDETYLPVLRNPSVHDTILFAGGICFISRKLESRIQIDNTTSTCEIGHYAVIFVRWRPFGIHGTALFKSSP